MTAKAKPEELTDFQWKIIMFLQKRGNDGSGGWGIAAGAFPERWKKRAARGAMVGHIRRACWKMQHAVIRSPPKDQWDDSRYYLRGEFVL